MTTSSHQVIRVGHSPDPDDAFMFHALANDKIPTGNLKFVHELQDIETLNRRAMNGELEVSAVSIHAYSYLLDKYALKYARDMDVKLADKFVGMYVNHWTLDYGDHGRAAVRRLLDEGHRFGVIPHPAEVEFVE